MNPEFKINNKIIETNRTILRSFNNNDLEDLFEMSMIFGFSIKFKNH